MQQQGGNIFAMIHSHSSTQVAVYSPMLHGPRYLVTPMVSLSLLGKGNFPTRLLHINFTLYSMHETSISSMWSSYCYISIAGKQGLGCFSLDYRALWVTFTLSFSLTLSLLPPILTLTHTPFLEKYNTLFCLLLAKHTLSIPLNTNLLPPPQKFSKFPWGLRLFQDKC